MVVCVSLVNMYCQTSYNENCELLVNVVFDAHTGVRVVVCYDMSK